MRHLKDICFCEFQNWKVLHPPPPEFLFRWSVTSRQMNDSATRRSSASVALRSFLLCDLAEFSRSASISEGSGMLAAKISEDFLQRRPEFNLLRSFISSISFVVTCGWNSSRHPSDFGWPRCLVKRWVSAVFVWWKLSLVDFAFEGGGVLRICIFIEVVEFGAGVGVP